ncbi:hypothetical protein [Paraburkholderia azotifigens]|uniref:MarR family transcriptional regulator n=1 Tax=Paraburkholderia azotifigens TaxID=2057004 RepID=A0ABU9QZH4_9BURK
MKRSINWDLIETRESIRESAYDLASSRLCNGWQDVWRALRARYSLDQLAVIFENPLFRLDIDQRCYLARNPPTVARDVQRGPGAVGQRASSTVTCSNPGALVERNPRSERLARRMQTLLADGGECTAVELAERLGTSRNEVLIAAREMLSDGTLRIARYIASSRGGRGARVFVLTGAAAHRGHSAVAHSTWPKADPVVVHAFDAIVRCR